MNRVIWRHAMDVTTIRVNMREGDRVLDIATQGGLPCVWIEHQLPATTNRQVVFTLVPTGDEVPDGYDYCGTAHDVNGMGFVMHVYRRDAS